MKGQGEYIAAVVLTMIIILIAMLAINWARYIEDIGRIQVINIVKNKERLIVIWPYEDNRSKALIVNQWDGNSEIKGILVIYKQQLLIKILNSSAYNNTDLSITNIRIVDLKNLGLSDNELTDIDRICIITAFSNIFCNEYIPMKTVLPEAIGFKIGSSPLHVYVSSYDVVAPIMSHGFVEINSYGGQPSVRYFIRPFLPRVPIALVYTNGSEVFYANSGRRNLTIIVSYSSGVPSLVSTYLDGSSYSPLSSYVIGTLLIVDGVPFRVLPRYSGVAIYRADIYYAYISSNQTLYRVYSLSYPVRLSPWNLSTLIEITRSSISSGGIETCNIPSIIMNFPTYCLSGSRDFVNMTPIILANYTMLNDGSLKLAQLLTPMADTWRITPQFKNIYPDGYPGYKLLKDLSSRNIVMSRDILYIPIIRALPPSGNTYMVTAIMRDIVANTMNMTTIFLKPVGNGVWGNVTEIEYVRVVGDLATVRRSGISMSIDPLQWIFIDWNNIVSKTLIFRFSSTVMINPDRIAGFVIDNMGYITTTNYIGGGMIYRTPLAYITWRTTIFTTHVYTVMTTNPWSRVSGNQDWLSVFFADGGIMWIDHEYIRDLYPGSTKYLIKYPLTLTWQTQSPLWTPPTIATSSIPTSILPPLEDVIGILAIPTSGGEPWAQDIYLAYFQGKDTWVTVSYSIDKWILDGQSWSSLQGSSGIIVIGWGGRYKIGSMSYDNYYWWIIRYSVNGGPMQQVAIGNFKTPPKILTTITATITSTTGILTTTITIVSTSTSYIPPPGWERPIYYSIYNQDILYIAICMLMILFMVIIKLWEKIK